MQKSPTEGRGFLLHSRGRMPGVHVLWQVHCAHGVDGIQRRAHAVIFRLEIMRAREPQRRVGLFLAKDFLRAEPGKAFDFSWLRNQGFYRRVMQENEFTNPEAGAIDTRRAPVDEARRVYTNTRFFFYLLGGVRFIRFTRADMATQVGAPNAGIAFLV